MYVVVVSQQQLIFLLLYIFHVDTCYNMGIISKSKVVPVLDISLEARADNIDWFLISQAGSK